MKKKKVENNNYSIKRFIIVFMMSLCIVISMITYWIYAYYHKYGKNYFDGNIVSYNVNYYVDIQGNYVYIKNIDDDISNDFIEKQKNILNNNVIGVDIDREIYGDILSIKINYYLIGDISKVLTLNIDIRNKTIIDNEKIIKMVNYSYKDISRDIFDEYIKVSDDELVVDSVTGDKITGSEFNNSNKYLIRIREYIPDKLNVYIKDGKVWYSFNLSDVGNISYNKDWKNILINTEIGKI